VRHSKPISPSARGCVPAGFGSSSSVWRMASRCSGFHLSLAALDFAELWCASVRRQQVLRRDGILYRPGGRAVVEDGRRGRWGKGVFAILHGRSQAPGAGCAGTRAGAGAEGRVTWRGACGGGQESGAGGRRQMRWLSLVPSGSSKGCAGRAQGPGAYPEASDAHWQQMAVAEELNVAYGETQTCQRWLWPLVLSVPCNACLHGMQWDC